ncbi:unnamed protein product [Gongylonema pulchrum]|uniref:Inner membrane protein n=1 Tax=Gongylonema pulchrum TaxID=637853 RepID=A0A183D7M4_9BILA|nr:unnamed protein product [Gongylonema pulchrum]
MNEVHRLWLSLPLMWRLLNAIGSFLMCNTAPVCYLVIIIVHGQAACLLTLPLAILIMIVVTLCFKYTHLPWICPKGSTECAQWNISMIGRFVGIADEPMSVTLFCLLVLALFAHRHVLRVSCCPKRK